MPKPRNIIPPTKLTFSLPQDLRARLDLYLFSEVENRVPHGAYQDFLGELIREALDGETLDLAPFVTGLPPGTALVKGAGRTIDTLRRILVS